ncbi:hypothetical protein WAF17_16550 [Bernardetia sp. ABR2-2B]|uniref:hypothetical protein n=1 Tax=Bernardetia sp. ABR2-2B TaxID=3127472 RepID=UPI0030D0624E
MNKTLQLNLTKKWFDMILSGQKSEEYRSITDYWVRRLCQKVKNGQYTIKHFDSIIFSNGYSKTRPKFEIELKSIEIAQGKEEWGAEKDKNYFVLKLGKILDKQNCNNLDYLDSKINLAKDTWKDIDAEEYINEVRGI